MSDSNVAKPGGGPRSLACHGNAADVRAWSNIPYYFFGAGQRAGFLTDALDTMDPAYSRRRLRWSLAAPLRLERPGGYQYSRTSVRRMWEQVPPELQRGEIISHFQLFPPLPEAQMAGVRHSFYCDATLKQLFDYGGTKHIGKRTFADAMAREKELYQAARFVVSMARATADCVIQEYGVDPKKVFAVKPGANLDEPAVLDYLARRGRSWRREGKEFSAENPARLGFIGREYERKGLPRLVAAAEELDRRGRRVRVTIIGNCPEHFRNHPLVEAVGFLDKRNDTARFLETIDRFAIGCLPSYFEPLGISTLEALRLGVPVMGAATGGIPDCVPKDAGFLVPVGATGEQIADEMEVRLFDVVRYNAMVVAAEAEAESVTWDTTARRFCDIWSGSAS